MNKSDIEELYFITYIENIPSIMQRGIMCHSKAQKFNPRDISEPGVQELRAKKKIPGTKRKLHDYANLYFDAHNPMLSKRRSENDIICVLRVNKTVLDLDNVIVTDKNAARTWDPCWFKSVFEGLPLLDKQEVYATFWTHEDYWEQERLKGIKCAEVLIPGQIAPEYIAGAYVANNNALNYFQEISSLSVEIKNGLFF